MVKSSDVEAQLQRILSSPTFIRSPRSAQFLMFCVARRSGEHAITLKETTIAVEVFNRPPDYDPKSDPIVRVHARRVRERLEFYYRTQGSHDIVLIDLPKGTYVPRISRKLPARKTDFSDWSDQAPAIGVSDVARPSASFQTISSKPSTPLQITRPLEFLLLLLLLVVSSLLVRSLTHHSAPAHLLLDVRQLPGIPAHSSDPVWSPDAKRLAFTVADSATGVMHIYVKNSLGKDPATRLTQDKTSEMKPVWSPDGRSIAYVSSLSLSSFNLVSLRLADGSTRMYGPFNVSAYVTEQHPALDWSPDGRFLLTTEQMSPSTPMRLVRISIASGDRVALTSPPTGSTGDIDGKFSPDGKWVAFRRGGIGDLYVVSSQGEQERPALRLTYDMSGVRGIAWSADSGSVLFGTDRGVDYQFKIWSIPVAGGTAQPLSPSNFDAVDPAITRSGMLVFAHRELVTALTEHSLDGRTPDRILFPSTRIDMAPAISPDGKLVAFASTRGGLEQLWIGHTSQPTPVQATNFHDRGLVLYPSWSPDSRTVAFSFREGAATNIYLYSVPTGEIKQITSTRNRDITPMFSADGKYLYYSSNDDGTSRIWRVRTDGLERPEPMFWEAVTGYLPSADGHWMYFVESGQSLNLIRRNLQNGSSEVVFHTIGSPSFVNDLATANGFIYMAVSTDNTSQADVFQIFPETGRSKLIAHLTDRPPYEVSGFTISPNGQSLIASQTVRNESDLYRQSLQRF